MALIGKIRGMRLRDGKSISEISRLTSLSRNTIKKWLKTPQGAVPKYRRHDTATKLAPFIGTLVNVLEIDARRAKHERRTARALHAELRSEGYAGGYTRLTDFIRQWRAEQGKLVSSHAFVPLAFELGEAFQFNGMDAPTRNGIDVPKWKRYFNHLNREGRPS
jgi:transposase-like protein